MFIFSFLVIFGSFLVRSLSFSLSFVWPNSFCRTPIAAGQGESKSPMNFFAFGFVMNMSPNHKSQKTREGCGCFWGLCGSSGGKFRENSGKIAGKFFPNRQMLQILGFRAPGKANPPGTLGPHCRDLVPTFRAGCFLKSTVPAFSSFSKNRKS